MAVNFHIFKKLYYAFFLSIAIVLFGIIGFMYIEEFNFLDAFYMTIITVTTVGFQEVHLLSAMGRLFTTFLIITSFGTFAYAISVITTYIAGGDFKVNYKDYRVNSEVKKLKDHVIVCGYGRNGEQAVRKLIAHEQNFVVIDTNTKQVVALRDDHKYLFVNGDATLDDTLERAGISKAKALISALPKDSDNLYVVLTARQKNSKLKIISRASHDESYSKLKIAGADNVIMPDKVGGAHMASLVTTPDVVEFLDNITLEGEATINLEEISFDEITKNSHYKTLKDLNARSLSGCSIIGFKTTGGEYVINPGPDTELLPKSKLFVLGKPEQIKEFHKLFHV